MEMGTCAFFRFGETFLIKKANNNIYKVNIFASDCILFLSNGRCKCIMRREKPHIWEYQTTTWHTLRLKANDCSVVVQKLTPTAPTCPLRI